MNVLLMALAYLLYMMLKPSENKSFLSGIDFEKITPLLSMFSSGGMDIQALLESDIMKNQNFFGMDMTKIAPILQVAGTFLNKGESSQKNDGVNAAQDDEPPKPKQNTPSFPLSPIADIADKNITYSLTKYLSEK